MARYLVALGSSHKSGFQYINNAIKQIATINGITLISSSRIYKNCSLGTTYNSLFYNCVCAIFAHHNALVLYRELLVIENLLGRIRSYKFARRTIDIDVLLSVDFSFKFGNFELPHREAFNRNFFVIPALEALELTDWPVPIKLLRARNSGYLCPRE